MKWPIYRKSGADEVSRARTCMFYYNLNGYRGAIRCMIGLINLGLFGGRGGIDSVRVKSIRLDRSSYEMCMVCAMTKNVNGMPVLMTKEFSGVALDEFSVLHAIKVALYECVGASYDSDLAKIRFDSMFNELLKDILADPAYGVKLPWRSV